MALSAQGSFLVIIALCTSFLAMALHIVAFATNNWLESFAPSPFVSIGFHYACFNKCTWPYCPADNQIVYDNCHRLLDELYFRDLKAWIMPDWFLSTRVYSIILTPLSMLPFFHLIVSSCIVCIWRYPRTKTDGRYYCLESSLIFTGIFSLAGGILGVYILAIWAVNSFEETWLPLPEKNRFGWSFIIEASAVFLLFVTFLISILGSVFKFIARLTPKEPMIADDMMLGTLGSRF